LFRNKVTMRSTAYTWSV